MAEVTMTRRSRTRDEQESSLRGLAWVFIRLGATAFGGPAAHIAMMEDEVVRRRRWLAREEFLDLLGATTFIPGPNSTEMAIHIGWHRARWAGLLLAGCCFIIPASLIVFAIAWAYVRFGTRPEAAGLLYGVKPVIIAVVAQALWGLGRTAAKSKSLVTLGVSGAVLSLLGVHELVVLFGSGLLAVALLRLRAHRRGGVSLSALAVAPFALSAPSAGVAGGAAAVPFGLWPLFLFFLKVGSVLFGSGYVLLAFLRADLVERWGWLSEAQLLDAVAIGQVTPGPVFTSATFIGYVLGGVPGAALATLGIFLPAFFFVALSGPLVPRLRRSAAAGAFLDGVNVASLALMAAVTGQLARAAIIDAWTVALAASSAVLFLRYRVNSAWLILTGGAIGLLLTAR